MSIYGTFKGRGPNGFGYNDTADKVSEGLDLAGKTYLLTGANSGLGEDTLRVLVKRGARVIAAGRTTAKAQAVCERFGGVTIPLACELSEPDSVREAVATVKEIGHELDGIIANAGIMALPERTVKHGLELQFLTNHVGHFILVMGLLDQLADNGRVVMLSSAAHFQAYKEGIRFDDLDAAKHYSAWGAYGQSKLANLLFAKHLATRLPKPAQSANSVHPGVIPTNLVRNMGLARPANWAFRHLGPILVLKNMAQGSATQVYVATHPGAAKISGEYWSHCNPASTSQHGVDAAMAQRLWDKTEELVAAR